MGPGLQRSLFNWRSTVLRIEAILRAISPIMFTFIKNSSPHSWTRRRAIGFRQWRDVNDDQSNQCEHRKAVCFYAHLLWCTNTPLARGDAEQHVPSNIMLVFDHPALLSRTFDVHQLHDFVPHQRALCSHRDCMVAQRSPLPLGCTAHHFRRSSHTHLVGKIKIQQGKNIGHSRWSSCTLPPYSWFTGHNSRALLMLEPSPRSRGALKLRAREPAPWSSAIIIKEDVLEKNGNVDILNYNRPDNDLLSV